MIRLGVNVDHIATLRQARGGREPNPLEAAFLCEKAGADGITVHLREDRRHIQDHDVRAINNHVLLPLNLEMAMCQEIIELALEVKPRSVTLVPEKRKELTTEGGLNVLKQFEKLRTIIPAFQKELIQVSLFVNPDLDQIKAASESGADFVELHTGDYAGAFLKRGRLKELKRLNQGAEAAVQAGLKVNAGHGLNYQNVREVLKLPGLYELNIGHSIMSRAVLVGMEKAVGDMVAILHLEKS